MKKNHFMTLPKLCAVALLGATTFLASCAVDGFKDESFVGTYGPTDMVTPAASEITVTPSADNLTQTISWPAVSGAGKYIVSLYKGTVSGGEEEIASVVEEDRTIKVNSVTFPREEETNYIFKLRVLDNEPEGNKSDGKTTVFPFSSFAPAYASIPAGTDLNQWFSENPIPETAQTEMLIYELEAGGQYTVSDDLSFDGNKVGLRSTNKVNHAKISYTSANSTISTTAGMEIRYIDFDCSAMSGSKGVFGFSKNSTVTAANVLDPGKYKWTGALIPDPITIAGCNFDNVKGYFFFDNSVKTWATSLNIDNCLVHMTPESSIGGAVIYTNKAGHVNNFTCSNSTFYESPDCTGDIKYFYQAGLAKAPDLYVDGSDDAAKATNTTTYKNSTFYHVTWNNGQWGNYNGMQGKTYSFWVMTNCIFYDCSTGGSVPRRFLHGQSYANNPECKTFLNNTYMKNDGTFQDPQTYDTSGTIIEEDPQFANPATGDFHISGAKQVALKTGDPRWLPAAN